MYIKKQNGNKFNILKQTSNAKAKKQANDALIEKENNDKERFDY